MKDNNHISLSTIAAGIGVGAAAWYFSEKLSPGLAVAFIGGTLTVTCLHLERKLRELRELMNRQ